MIPDTKNKLPHWYNGAKPCRDINESARLQGFESGGALKLNNAACLPNRMISLVKRNFRKRKSLGSLVEPVEGATAGVSVIDLQVTLST
jgi:hypothetical protein